VNDNAETTGIQVTMQAIRLINPGGPDALALEVVDTPRLRPGEALVKVHAAAITRDELQWPVDRLPAIPSYEMSGEVVAVADDVHDAGVGEAVYALLSFDRDGAAADYVVTAANLLAPKPRTLDDVESAALPLPALSAWQALFDHGHLERGQRVLILGALGGVGHLAVQIAHARGVHVIGTASPANADAVRSLGADEVLDDVAWSTGGLAPVDLVFDTVGGDRFARAAALVREGGGMVSIAEEPPEGIEADYFVVEPNRDQLMELTHLADDGALRPQIDSVFALGDARAAFERSLAGSKRGKVVLRVGDQ
jgi:NADPH:quinone reductase-like Zn-dependent oxidoreductase